MLSEMQISPRFDLVQKHDAKLDSRRELSDKYEQMSDNMAGNLGQKDELVHELLTLDDTLQDKGVTTACAQMNHVIMTIDESNACLII